MGLVIGLIVVMDVDVGVFGKGFNLLWIFLYNVVYRVKKYLKNFIIVIIEKIVC